LPAIDLQRGIQDWKNVVATLVRSTNDINKLAEYSLHISRILAYPDLNIDYVLKQIDTMGLELKERIKNLRPLRPTQLIEEINEFFFNKVGFKPNAHDYYNPANNYINIVFERKSGIPITLSIIKYLLDDQSAEIIIDPFNLGRIMDDYSLKELLERSYPHQNIVLTRALLDKATPSQVVVRLLNNLKNSFYESDDLDRTELANEMIFCVDDTDPFSIRDKGMILLKRGQQVEALVTLTKYLEMHPETNDADTILEIIRQIRSQVR
jgi:regulator of sirC expression with transglutaminase-like and TPR domain